MAIGYNDITRDDIEYNPNAIDWMNQTLDEGRGTSDDYTLDNMEDNEFYNKSGRYSKDEFGNTIDEFPEMNHNREMSYTMEPMSRQDIEDHWSPEMNFDDYKGFDLNPDQWGEYKEDLKKYLDESFDKGTSPVISPNQFDIYNEWSGERDDRRKKYLEEQELFKLSPKELRERGIK